MRSDSISDPLPKSVAGIWDIALVIFTLCLLATSGRAQNLLPDGSFEQTKERDRWGLVFSQWDGNIYEPPAYFEASTIAHGGKYSCEMIGDAGGKIRIFSKEITLKPGRYRVGLLIRGMDIGPGPWENSTDFSCGFDDKFFNLKKKGTFGWTPLHYVFDISAQQARKPFRLFVGLTGGGRLWVDDASLEKVDASAALTPEPVLGAEEHSIAPPEPLGKAAFHCSACGYLNNPGHERCYACGHELLHDERPANAAGPAMKIIADFADGKPAPFEGGIIVEEQGHKALELQEGYVDTQRPQDWSGYDYLCYDVFNPSDQGVPGGIEVRDKQTRDYWTRVNAITVYPPGKSTIRFRTDLYVGEKSRPGRRLLADQITRLVIVGQKGVRLSNIRLERIDDSPAHFPGLLALSFGPSAAPLMEGFRRGTTNLEYSPLRGYGWTKANFWQTFNVLQPDPLFESFVTPTDAIFRADLPNGVYHVWLNLDSPGGYWGEPQVYTQRQLTANGKVVAEDQMNYDAFLARYYRNAAREDLPGIDTFAQYVQPMFSLKEFDVSVSDGKLELGFKGESWANCLSALVIYPADKGAQGKAFLDWVTQRRRAQFEDSFKQVQPKRGPRPAAGDVVFARPADKAVNAFDAPGSGEEVTDAGLELTLARAEEAPLTFAVQPAGDLGAMDLSISPFTNEQGQVLDASAFRPGWIDYRITRVEADGSVYTVAPRYWHPTPAPAALGVTRRFWIRIKIPATAAPGIYHGTVTIEPKQGSAARKVPVMLRVLPFALDEITDVAVGPFGSGIDLPWDSSDARTQAWDWAMFSKALDVLRDAGCTSFSGRPHLHARAADGKITLDTTQADREMELIRAKGFTQLISSYGEEIDLGYRIYGSDSGPDVEAARNAGFADMHAFLKALYSAIDAHAVEKNWLPVAWNLCDEPLGDALPGAAANAKAHREILPGLKRTTFTGATSLAQEKPGEDLTKNPSYELTCALPMPALNGHDAASIRALHDVGDRFCFYNGGNRWTYGRYMKMLVVKEGLVQRVTWHFNVCADDPYYALDAREDDYCWFNTDAKQTMVPSLSFLAEILPGLNDYRYLSTLQRLLKEKANDPSAAAAQKVLDEMLSLRPGADRGESDEPTDVGRHPDFAGDRAKVTQAILSLQRP